MRRAALAALRNQRLHMVSYQIPPGNRIKLDQFWKSPGAFIYLNAWSSRRAGEVAMTRPIRKKILHHLQCLSVNV
jgi:hypothetical protein